jgi:transposase
MRGVDPKQQSFLCVVNVEERIPENHPLRGIKAMSDEVLRGMDRELGKMYSQTGRRSIPPEQLLKGMLLCALYTIRSEAQFCEQLQYNMLYRWFLDMDMVEQPFDHCAFSDNRERFIKHDAAGLFFRSIRAKAEALQLMSHEHFSVDGTLLEAWASMKSFRPKQENPNDKSGPDSNGWSDYKDTKRTNETHQSRTDSDARLLRKGLGKEAKLCFAGHVLMENRNGLVAEVRVTEANGTCERTAALEMMRGRGGSGVTLGADAGYTTGPFVKECIAAQIEPHVADRDHFMASRKYPGGYPISQTVRKRIEQIFGWAKTCGGVRKLKTIGLPKAQFHFTLVAAAYNLLRITKLREA